MSNVCPNCSQLCQAVMPDGQPVREYMTYKKHVAKQFMDLGNVHSLHN